MKTDFEITPEMAEWKDGFAGRSLDDPTWQQIVCAGLFRWLKAYKFDEDKELRDNIKEIFNIT